MVLKTAFATVFFAALLAGNAAIADGYQPDEFLHLDLSKAALSPKLLGPPTQFEPVPVQARTDLQSKSEPQNKPAPQTNAAPQTKAAHAEVKPKIAPKIAVAHVHPEMHVRAEKRHGMARTTLVRRHGNPLDAQAADTRIQVWPCRSGGICNWQRPARGE